MSSQDQRPDTLDARLDRVIEEAAKPGFDLDKHADDLVAAYVTESTRYDDILSILKRSDRPTAIKLQRLVNNGQSGPFLVDDEQAHCRICDVFADAPVPEYAIAPKGWSIRSMTGAGPCIIKLCSDQQRMRAVLSHPLVVSSVSTNLSTGEVLLELAWQYHQDGGWKKRFFPKRLMGSKTKFASELANAGISVNANTSGYVMEWLDAYQEINAGVTPATKTTNELGWAGDGFLLPTLSIGQTKNMKYVPGGDGCEQVVSAIRTVGSVDDWRDGVASIAEFPLVRVGIYGALSSALLHPLLPNDTNPIIDWSYRTSTGKTTTLQIAATVWGDMESMLTSWNGSDQGIIARTIATNHLPTLIDDTKGARERGGKSAVPKLIYELSAGKESTRNSPDGLKRARVFRTTVLSTGEHKAIDSDKSGGTVARVLSLWGSPFGGESNEIAARINNCRMIIEGNYGHAGPMFVEYVVSNKDKWKPWRDEIIALSAMIRDRLNKDKRIPKGLLDRSARIVALLQVTANIADRCVSLPWACPNIIEDLYPSLTDNATQSNREAEAFQWVMSRVAASPGRIVDSTTEYESQHGNVSLLGVQSDYIDDCYVAVFDSALVTELKSGGYNPQATIRIWRENGWARTERVDWLANHTVMTVLTQTGVEETSGW